MISLAVFLGNPGTQYRRTRHNAAWMMLDSLPHFGSAAWSRKFRGETARITFAGGTLHLLKPLTLMNRSGESIGTAAAFLRIAPSEILVVHDDVELDLGEIGLKFGGGLAGHNGLKSAVSALGTRDFYRLRIGIGRPARGSVSSFVLGSFSADELESLDTIFTESGSLLTRACTAETGLEALVNQNSRLLVLRK